MIGIRPSGTRRAIDHVLQLAKTFEVAAEYRSKRHAADDHNQSTLRSWRGPSNRSGGRANAARSRAEFRSVGT